MAYFPNAQLHTPEANEEKERLDEIVRSLTDGKYAVLRRAYDDALYVTRVPYRGCWWLIPPGGFANIYFHFANELRLDFATYIATSGKELPIDFLKKKDKCKFLAKKITEEATSRE